MAGIVRGIREVRQVTVSVEGPGVAVLRGEHVGLRRGPIITRMTRLKLDLLPGAWARVLAAPRQVPDNTGAGPCGTLARGRFAASCPHRAAPPSWYETRPRREVQSPLAWSISHLVEPLAHYYATYEPPVRLGAKGTPRGRRVA